MAREKTVYPSDEIAHLWAHQTKAFARNAQGNHRFDRDVIFSYAQPIARIVKGKGRGRQVVLMRNRTWNVTTSRHQRFVRDATRHMDVFNVADIGGIYLARCPVSHKANLKDYARRIIDAAKAAKRARANAEWCLNALAALVDEANRYAASFGLKTAFAVPSDTDLAALEQRAREESARQARKNAKLRAEREAAERVYLEELKTFLAEWQQGKDIGDKLYSLRNLPGSYARVEGLEVVTTRGARVPLYHVQRALPIVLRLIERGETYQRNGHTIHLGHYALDSIDTAGNVRAGCHTFDKAEIQRLASVLATLPPAPAPAPEAIPA